MYRCAFLSLTIATLAQVMPPGCPLAAPPDVDNDPPPVRLSIETTAESDVESAATGQTVELSASADSERGAVSYSWVQTGGPGVSIIDADRRQASFVARSLLEQQTLTFVVSTRNSSGDVGRAEVSVVVLADSNFETGEGPIARAGGDRSVTPGSLVTLDGSASTGSGLSFSWSQVFGDPKVALSGADMSRPTFTAPSFELGSSNELRFELSVRDDQDRSSRDTVTVSIRESGTSTGENNEGAETGKKPRVRFVTTMGEFVIELEPNLAPKTVSNFLRYVRDDFYVGLIFHRVISDFVVQGGGFTPLMQQVETRDPIPLESDNGLLNVRGSVGMARQAAADSATSQFFVNLKDNTDLDYTETNDGFGVFGRVVEGMDVIDAIAGVRTSNRGFPPNLFPDVPVVDVIIEDARIE